MMTLSILGKYTSQYSHSHSQNRKSSQLISFFKPSTFCFQSKCDSWGKGREIDDDWISRSCRYLLRPMRFHCWMEIRKILYFTMQNESPVFMILFYSVILVHCLQETAREKSQKYKEGKSVLERSVSCLISTL